MIVSIVILVSVSSFFIGRQVEVKNTLYGKQLKSEESTQVAVVNQDVGIDYKEKNVNYALDLVKSFDSDFILTNRESAKKGIEDGKYGAMVIIPGNFSQNITTINDVTPSRVQIYYETNDKLSEENKLVVSAKVSDLEKKLNNKLSYMYITSIFDEVHHAQDYASDILKNDTADLDAINSINDADILQSINLTVLEDENIDLTDLDLNKNFEENKSIIEEIDKKYRERLLAKEKSFDGIKDELLKVTGNSSTGIKSFRSEIENMTPEQLKVALTKKHNYNYDDLSSNYDVNVKDVNKYVEDLTDEGGGIDNLVTTYNQDILSEVDKKGKSAIKQSNENLSAIKETTDSNIDIIQNNSIGRLNGLKSNIISGNANDPKLQSLNEEYLLYGEMVSQLRTINPGMFENIYKNTVDENKVNYAKILKDPTGELAPNNTFANWNELKAYITNVPANKNDAFVIARSSKYKGIDANDVTLNVNTKLIDNIIYDLNGVQSKLKQTSISTDSVMNNSDYRYINNLFSEDTEVSLDEKLKLKESLIKEIKGNLGGDNQQSLVDNIKKNNLENVGSIKQKVENEVEKVVSDDGPINVNSLLKIFDENYMSRFDNLIKQINELDKTEKTVDKDKEITELWNKFDHSNNDLTKSVTKQLDDNDKTVEKARDDADKHVTTMQDDLDKGIQASQGKITSGLENVKETKTNTTNSNQEKLGSLSQVLSNSRVGTVENTEVYNFMINPVTAIQSKDIAGKIIKPQQDNNYKNTTIIAMISTIFLSIIAIIILRYNKKVKKNN